MSLEDNKTLMRRLMNEGLNAGNLAIIDEIMSPDFVEHQVLPMQGSGRDVVKQLFAMLRTAFPDIHFTFDDIIAEGDKVMARGTARSTHLGPYMGVPPTGKPVRVTIYDVVRIKDGKMVEHWGLTDALGLMQQIGVVQLPVPAGRPER